MSSLNVEAIVLRRFPLGETDRIYTLFSRQIGRVRGVAARATSPRSRWTGILEPFNIVRAEMKMKSKSDLHRILQASIVRLHPKLPGSLNSLASGFEILEVLDRFVPDEEPNDLLFSLATEAIKAINDFPDAASRISSLFHLSFFQISGYKFIFNRCVNCSKVRGNRTAKISIPLGGVVCTACSSHISCDFAISKTAIKWLVNPSIEESLKTDTMLEMSSCLPEIQKFINAVFDYYFERRPRSHSVLISPDATR